MVNNKDWLIKKTFKFHFLSNTINFNLDNLRLFMIFDNSSYIFFNINYSNDIDLENLYNFSNF